MRRFVDDREPAAAARLSSLQHAERATSGGDQHEKPPGAVAVAGHRLAAHESAVPGAAGGYDNGDPERSDALLHDVVGGSSWSAFC